VAGQYCRNARTCTLVKKTDEDGVVGVQYDTGQLDRGQGVRILGIVQKPFEGQNAFGATALWPLVLPVLFSSP
jgi:hypothetical protein